MAQIVLLIIFAALGLNFFLENCIIVAHGAAKLREVTEMGAICGRQELFSYLKL